MPIYIVSPACSSPNKTHYTVGRYASLYFCCAIDSDDNELLTLEIIHRYVELLDKYFGSVRTLRWLGGDAAKNKWYPSQELFTMPRGILGCNDQCMILFPCHKAIMHPFDDQCKTGFVCIGDVNR